jgi:hypothetical protein
MRLLGVWTTFLLTFITCMGLEYPSDAVVRHYSMTLTHAYHNPDGRFKGGYLINGQSPGPTIEGDEGDWIELTVEIFCLWEYLSTSMECCRKVPHGLMEYRG